MQELKNIPIEKLQRGKYQPRQHFAEEALRELAASIKEQGIIEPIVVRIIPNADMYEIIAGERRWRASQMAGLDTVPCVVRQCTDDQAAEVTIIENIQREDLNPIEEAQGYQRLVSDFGYLHEEVAIAVGKSRVKISNMLRLLTLEPRVQDLLRMKAISEGHGKVLAGLPNEQQFVLANKVIKNQWSVRRLEKEVKLLQDGGELLHSANDPNVKRLERELGEYLGSQVVINYDTHGRGKVTVDFTNYEILQGVMRKMGYRDE